MATRAFLFIAVGCALDVVTLGAARSVVIEGRKILVDGEVLHLKGVNWNPVPLGGRERIDADGTFHSDADFAQAVKDDAKLMRVAGINAVRTYTLVTDPHVLDVLEANGIYLLNTVYRGHEDLNVEVGRMQAVIDHPAVLMWVIGNEWNDQHCYARLTHDECRERIKEGIRRVKSADPTRPVATVYGKLPTRTTIEELEGVGVDVWGINYYNGTTFGELFDIWAERSTAPMFIGEFGADAWNTVEDREDLEAQAHATQLLTEEIVNHSVVNGGVASGGMIFEFSDEWWKDWNSSPDDHSTRGFKWFDTVADTYGPYPDWRYNEEWWGLVDIHRSPRPAYTAYAKVRAPARRLAQRGPAASDATTDFV